MHANRKMAWLSAQSGPPTALARVETSHEVEFLVKSEEENLAELMFEERARRAKEKMEKRKERSQTMKDQRPAATEEEWLSLIHI